MIRFENSIMIERPVEAVFDFVADFKNVPKWNYYVLNVQKTSMGPIGLGTTYHQERKTDQQHFSITEYDPNRKLTIQTASGSEPQFEMCFHFEPVNGGTKLVDAWELETGRNPLLEWLGTGQIKAAVAQNLGKLKELLETGQTQLQDGRSSHL